ncbi:MAG: hypothetical protein IK122_01740, partial [Alphaproteobacteria bacterium]|nr:hypothetical protein [Alphaproteobacteria bacterium]
LYIKNGVKIDTLFNNAKTIILILCILGVVKPIVNFIYGDDLFGQQCEIKQVSRATVNELLNQRNKKLGKSDENLLYENFNIVDSGPVYSGEPDEHISISHETANVLNESEIETINKQSSFSGFRASDIVAVEYGNRTTIYVKKDGTKIKRIGGTVAWRNNNPGNIKKSSFARNNGAVGETDKWAVFPNEETGLIAITKLLRTDGYNQLSISEAIHKWAPASDNNHPVTYSRNVSKMTGLSINTKIKDISDNDLMRVARAIQKVEGWAVGTEQKI